MKEFVVLLLVLVASADAGRPYGQPSYSTGPQKFQRDQYTGEYYPVPGGSGGRPIGTFHQGGLGVGRPPHAASHIHGQQGFTQGLSHHGQNQQFHQGVPSHLGHSQQGFPQQHGQGQQFTQGFPSTHGHNQQFHQGHPSAGLQQGHHQPHVSPGINTQLGSGLDLSTFARTGQTSGKTKKH